MPKIDLDVNFPMLIIVLSILLITLVEGGRINELVYHRSGDAGRVLFSFIFVMGGMLIIFGLLTAAYAIRNVSYIAITVGFLIVLANILGYFIEGTFDGFMFGELVSGALIITGAFLLVLSNRESGLR